MKKLFTFLLICLFSATVFGQLTVTVPTITATPGSTVVIPVKLIGASSTGIPIGSANIQITYDESVLTYVSLQNFYPGTPQSQWFYSGHDGIVAANWLEPNLLTITVPDSTTLFEIQFTYFGGNSPLNFIIYEFTDAAYELIPTTPVNGAVTQLPVEHNITFNVDMSRQNVSPNGVHIAGSFNNWNPSQTVLTNTGNNVYLAIVSIVEGAEVTYRFVNGNSNSGLETVPEGCGISNGSGGYNRFLTVPDNDTTLPVKCFNMCDICPVDVPVTFSVDMSEQNISSDGIHLSGSFNGWSASSTPMYYQGNNIYSATVTLTSGTQQTYKFINGSTISGSEIVPQECGVPDGYGGYVRSIDIPRIDDTTLSTVCFSQCGPCPPPASISVTFRIDMSTQNVSVNGIHIAGTFNNWSCTSIPMTLTNENIYETTLILNEGEYYEYRFVNGNTWTDIETVPSGCSMNGNRYITIPDSDTSLAALCFGSCYICPQSTEVNITFRVNMSEQTVSPSGIHLAGSFNNWNTSSMPMANSGNDIYSATLPLMSGTYQTYRFVNGDMQADFEIVPSTCGSPDTNNIYNRYFTVPSSDSVLNIICFNKCVNCEDTALYSNIIFQVDMRNEEISPAGVHIAGSFQGWNPELNPMTNNGNNIYTYTLNILSGSFIEYKYVNGITNSDYENVPEECGNNGNRYLDVPANDTIIRLVCYAGCDSCTTPQQEVMVTFNIDMTAMEVSPLGVHIAGSFNGWDPAATILTPGALNVYSVSIPLFSSNYYEYKFINGDSWDGAEDIPSGCTHNNNRYLYIPDHDTSIIANCYASCIPCQVGIIKNDSVVFLKQNYPNPCNEMTTIDFEINEEGYAKLIIYNNLGDEIAILYNTYIKKGQYSLSFNTEKLPQGIYYYMLFFSGRNNTYLQSKKLMVQ